MYIKLNELNTGDKFKADLYNPKTGKKGIIGKLIETDGIKGTVDIKGVGEMIFYLDLPVEKIERKEK